MRSEVKASLDLFTIQRPQVEAPVHCQKALFFEPPIEARNPELTIASHLAQPKLKDVLNLKHVPLRYFLQGSDGGEAFRPKSAYEEAYLNFHTGSEASEQHRSE